jgi:S1-C subfamily serine protease
MHRLKTIPLLLCIGWASVCCGKSEPEPSSGANPETASEEPSPSFSLSFDRSPIIRETGPNLNSFAPILKEPKEAVVAVYTAEVQQFVRRTGPTSLEEYFFRRFFGLPAPSPAPITEAGIEERRIPQGAGSGVIVSADGYILTNNHVVSDQRGGDADEVLVQLVDGTEYPATIVGRDPRTDIAVLKIGGGPFPTVNQSFHDHRIEDDLPIGDRVYHTR